MDFTVALILVGIGVVAVLAREGYQRARAQPTARYLEALRRVHDTAHTDDRATVGGEPVAREAPSPWTPPSPPVPGLAPPPATRPRADLFRPRVASSPLLPRLLTRGRAAVAAAVVVALVALSGLGYVLAHHAASGPARATVPTTIPAANRSSPSPPTTAAVAAPAQTPVVVAGAQGSGTAAYTVTSGPVQLALAASTRCWVELRAVSDIGPVVFEGILGPGASQTFENAVGLWMRIGYPAGVVLAVDGRPVGLPASASPLDVTVHSATANPA